MQGMQHGPKMQHASGDPALPAPAQGDAHKAAKVGKCGGQNTSLHLPPAQPRGEQGSRKRIIKLQLGGGNERAEG